MTMSAADFLDQWFETDVLKATMSASGIIGTFLGIRSPGTAYVLLHHYMGEIDGAFRSWGFSRGGTGAISNCDCFGGARSRRGDPHASAGRENSGQEWPRCRRGFEIRRRDQLPTWSPPALTRISRLKNFSIRTNFPRNSSKACGATNSAAPPAKSISLWTRLPNFKCVARRRRASSRRNFHFSQHGIHGARLRRRQVRPFLAPALYRYGDSQPYRSVRRASGQARACPASCNTRLTNWLKARGTISAKPSATP